MLNPKLVKETSTDRKATIQKNVDNETLEVPTPNSEKAEQKKRQIAKYEIIGKFWT